MKFFLIAACVLLALAHGSQSAEVPDLEKYFEDMRAQLVSTTQELSEKINAQQLVGQAQALAAQIQEQLKPLATNIEEHLKPLGDNLQSQIKPMVDNFQLQMEEMLRKLMDQARAIGN